MRKLLALLILLSMVLMTGCPTPTLPPTTSGGGFFVSTFTSFDLGPPVIAPVVGLRLTWKKDLTDPIATDRSTGDEAFILGSGFNQQFGMPLLQYFDLNGNLVAQSSADAVAADGSWMSTPVPDISQLSVGTYVGILNNANSAGGYDILGVVSVQVVPPPPPPPIDPCPGGRCINQCDEIGEWWPLWAALLMSIHP